MTPIEARSGTFSGALLWDLDGTILSTAKAGSLSGPAVLELVGRDRRLRGPAKGNTLLNYCGIGTDFVDYTVDRNPHKQGKLLPGSHIPIRAPEELERTRPDLVLILPWNIQSEVVEQMAHVRAWGGRFVVPVPEPRIC